MNREPGDLPLQITSTGGVSRCAALRPACLCPAPMRHSIALPSNRDGSALMSNTPSGVHTQSPTTLIDIVFPGDTNHHGTFFGGAGLALMDRVAFIAATRYGRAPFVTASCERVDFRQPARIGHIVEFTALPVRAGRRSLTIEVEMVAEAIAGRERHVCTRGVFHMVAIPEEQSASDWMLPPLKSQAEPPRSEGAAMVDIVFPDQANSAGKMFGGEAVAYMTKAAFIAASRLSGRLTVLASSERIDFSRPIAVGEIVEVCAEVIEIGRTSMKVQTVLYSENLLSGERHITATGHFVMVAVDANHKPVVVER